VGGIRLADGLSGEIIFVQIKLGERYNTTDARREASAEFLRQTTPSDHGRGECRVGGSLFEIVVASTPLQIRRSKRFHPERRDGVFCLFRPTHILRRFRSGCKKMVQASCMASVDCRGHCFRGQREHSSVASSRGGRILKWICENLRNLRTDLLPSVFICAPSVANNFAFRPFAPHRKLLV
jgi:hypothetical protein